MKYLFGTVEFITDRTKDAVAVDHGLSFQMSVTRSDKAALHGANGWRNMTALKGKTVLEKRKKTNNKIYTTNFNLVELFFKNKN